jgi:hypothetical protein
VNGLACRCGRYDQYRRDWERADTVPHLAKINAAVGSTVFGPDLYDPKWTPASLTAAIG